MILLDVNYCDFNELVDTLSTRDYCLDGRKNFAKDVEYKLIQMYNKNNSINIIDILKLNFKQYWRWGNCYENSLLIIYRVCLNLNLNFKDVITKNGYTEGMNFRKIYFTLFD
jgi:hypothetical protein